MVVNELPEDTNSQDKDMKILKTPVFNESNSFILILFSTVSCVIFTYALLMSVISYLKSERGGSLLEYHFIFLYIESFSL